MISIKNRWTSAVIATGKTVRQACEQNNADLRSADLTGADLTRANLTNANLTNANLRGADFGDLQIPAIENIDAAILAAIEQPGNLLEMDAWHTCGTTHCRAGWAIHLAGEDGYALEEKFGPNVAGGLIYAKSRHGMPVPNWFTTNKDALEDIKNCAGVN